MDEIVNLFTQEHGIYQEDFKFKVIILFLIIIIFFTNFFSNYMLHIFIFNTIKLYQLVFALLYYLLEIVLKIYKNWLIFFKYMGFFINIL